MVSQQLRVFFFPFLSPGHMIPFLKMATLFSQRGVSVTIITTPKNAPFIEPTVLHFATSSNPINLLLISFPSTVHHILPSGKENLSFIPFSSFSDFFHASFSLHQPLLELLQLHHPDCLVFDVMYHWAADIAHDLSITSIIFRCPGLFALCVENSLEIHTPYQHSNAFLIEGLPHRIELTKSEILESFLIPGLQEMRRESENKSFGIIVNSFYELEPEYGDLFRKEMSHRAWFLGPFSQYNSSNSVDDNIIHGVYNSSDNNGKIIDDPDSNTNNGEWLKWLESKTQSSVLFVCFGSLWEFSSNQLDEIAVALESSGYPFIWVVKKSGEWQPPKLNCGLVITKWAPQLMILNHPTIRGFITHCGWNSVLESIAAGVPMIGWPLMYEQFINAKLIVEVLKIGVKVQTNGGNVLVERLQEEEEVVVGREEIGKAIEKVMGGGKEAEAMRKRAKEYKEKANKAMDEGGSSYEDLSILIHELSDKKEKEACIGTTRHANA